MEQNQSTERHTSSVSQQVSEHQNAVSDLKNELKLCLKRLEAALRERGSITQLLSLCSPLGRRAPREL
jgi:hypothetical protein